MHIFKLNNVIGKLRYHDLPGRGIPLLFLHGMGCASSCDYPQVASDRALRGRHRILIDLLGSGFSDRPVEFGYTIDDHAETIAALIKRLGYNKVHLVGHSMGGSIAIVTAGLCSSKIGCLVLSEPNLDPGGGTFSRPISLHSEEEYVAYGHEKTVQRAFKQGNDIWASSLLVSLPLAIHREAVSLVNGSVPSWREQLNAMTLPRTVLFGEHSLPDPDTDRLLKIGVKVRIVPKSGHSMALENPSGLAQAISSSLSDALSPIAKPMQGS
jgi:pimeloyl-ACP methyl ester carboxylesterase